MAGRSLELRGFDCEYCWDGASAKWRCLTVFWPGVMLRRFWAVALVWGVVIELIGFLRQCYPACPRWNVVVPSGPHRGNGRLAKPNASQTHQPDSRGTRASDKRAHGRSAGDSRQCGRENAAV